MCPLGERGKVVCGRIEGALVEMYGGNWYRFRKPGIISQRLTAYCQNQIKANDEDIVSEVERGIAELEAFLAEQSLAVTV